MGILTMTRQDFSLVFGMGFLRRGHSLLVARWFMDDVAMYAMPNTGWFYDAGFLIGVAGSIPIGWVAAIISTVGHILK